MFPSHPSGRNANLDWPYGAYYNTSIDTECAFSEAVESIGTLSKYESFD